MTTTALRDQFPGLANNWHYLDTAATAQKPQVVLDAMMRAGGADYATVHRGVHLLLVEVHRLRAGLEAQVDPGASAHETPEARHQPAGREGGGRAQRHRAAAIAVTQQADAARQPVEGRAEVLGRQLPLLGEHEAARGAPEQRDPEVALEAANLVADRSRGDVQLPRGPSEAEQASRGLEGAQRRQGRKRLRHL